MKKDIIKYLLTNFFVFLLALSIYYNYSFQYYFKIDLRKLGFSNTLFSILADQNKIIISEKILENVVFRQEIEIQNVKINREHILVFFKKKNSFNFNNFLDEKINFDSVFELLLKERTKDYEALKGFLQVIDNPPNSVIEEVRRFSFATREIETLKNHKNEFKMKISEVLYKNPSLLDVLIFSITYLCISSVLILNHKKIKKNLFPKQ